MKLESLFGEPKTLASGLRRPPAASTKAPSTNGAATLVKPPTRLPGPIEVNWPEVPEQQPKNYKAILTADHLKAYLARCEETGLGGFDWETTVSEEYKARFIAKREALTAQIEATDDEKERELLQKEARDLEEAYLRAPLDPWKGAICTFSLSATPHEARVVPILHTKGRVFEPELSRPAALKLALDILDRRFFRSSKVVKIAVNLSFETKYAAKYGKYIQMPVADPLSMWVRLLQVTQPNKIKDPKRPVTGLGLKSMTYKTFGVQMGRFEDLLKKHDVDFFSDIDASEGEGLLYSAEDSDYAVQHYLYWREVAKQVGRYDDWLHRIEMPFQRVIGLMEYWGMPWDNDLAEQKRQEAEAAQEQAAEAIREIAKTACGVSVNTGKSGKTGDVRNLLFDVMKLPQAKQGKKGASLDEEAILDMIFMLQNNLHDVDEEKYLDEPLPDDWETRDPETDPYLSKAERMAIRIRRRDPHPYKDPGISVLEHLQRIQKYSTLLSAHIEGRQKWVHEVTGRIHANYTPWTETSRLNSNSPNGQNVPRMDNDTFGIRNFYKPKEGRILFLIDFSGFELRLMAWKSGDETMIELFRTGGDLHRKTASVLTRKPESEITKTERRNAKAGNFGISYGGTEHALQKTMKTDYQIRMSLENCAKIVNAVKAAYSRIPEYLRAIALDAREKGWVETMYGYIRLLPGINSPQGAIRGHAERAAGNTPVQGSAADVMKACQNDVYDEIARGTALHFDSLEAAAEERATGVNLLEHSPLCHGQADMIAQIHDEIIFECTDDADIVTAVVAWVKGRMEQPPTPDFPVPVEAEASVAYRWGEKMGVEKWLKEKKDLVESSRM